MKRKIIRSTTIPTSLDTFCEEMLKELSQWYEVVAVSSPGKEMDIICNREGVRTVAVPMERRISLKNDLISLWKMIKVMKREKPYMVHSMTPKAGLICMIASWLTRVPVRVHTFTGLVWPTSTGLKRKLLMATDWITCACATHVIPEGQGVMNDLINGGITKKPLKVLGYGNIKGIDLIQYDPARIEKFLENRKQKTAFTFLFVGRIVADKGIKELVRAFEKLKKETSAPIQLVLVGRFEPELDPLDSETLQIIDKTADILAIGERFGDDLLKEYAKADCFVMPSYREGFPNTVIEAGAMGLPSIVTDINGSREIIIQGQNGLIVPSKDTDNLYLAMKNVVENTENTQRMAENARPWIASRFEKSFVRKCLYDFYAEIMK